MSQSPHSFFVVFTFVAGSFHPLNVHTTFSFYCTNNYIQLTLASHRSTAHKTHRQLIMWEMSAKKMGKKLALAASTHWQTNTYTRLYKYHNMWGIFRGMTIHLISINYIPCALTKHFQCRLWLHSACLVCWCAAKWNCSRILLLQEFSVLRNKTSANEGFDVYFINSCLMPAWFFLFIIVVIAASAGSVAAGGFFFLLHSHSLKKRLFIWNVICMIT